MMGTQALAQLMACQMGTQTGEVGSQVAIVNSQPGGMGTGVVHIMVELMNSIPAILWEL